MAKKFNSCKLSLMELMDELDKEEPTEQQKSKEETQEK